MKRGIEVGAHVLVDGRVVLDFKADMFAAEARILLEMIRGAPHFPEIKPNKFYEMSLAIAEMDPE